MTKNNNTSLLSIDFTEITRAQKKGWIYIYR